MEHIGIGRTLLRELMKEGMPFVCLNPNTPHPKLRRYRFDPEAVMDWLGVRNAAEPPTPCATAEQKGAAR